MRSDRAPRGAQSPPPEGDYHVSNGARAAAVFEHFAFTWSVGTNDGQRSDHPPNQEGGVGDRGGGIACRGRLGTRRLDGPGERLARGAMALSGRLISGVPIPNLHHCARRLRREWQASLAILWVGKLKVPGARGRANKCKLRSARPGGEAQTSDTAIRPMVARADPRGVAAPARAHGRPRTHGSPIPPGSRGSCGHMAS
jgi:hypothetical protein